MVGTDCRSDALEALIRREVAGHGSISFARFMELSLYAPGLGYYEREDGQTGRAGDFYTSVSVGPELGFLLAAWMDGNLAQSNGLEWIEGGAHDGRLAADILSALDAYFPETAERVRYRILEPSDARRSVQARGLSSWGDRVIWSRSWDDIGVGVRGVVFSNELLDAMPVHRLAWDARDRRWWECGVTWRQGRWEWSRIEPVPNLIPLELEPLSDVLPDGFIFETSPAAAAWWGYAARALGEGWLVALDYGFGEEEAIRPERVNGTARSYSRHRVSDDLLAHPGEQDLTAHVDFSRVIGEGERNGLRTEAFLPQGRWLGQIATAVLARGGRPAEWLTAHARGLMTLTHPTHLGHAMRVLVQRR